MANQADILAHYDAHQEILLEVLDPILLGYSSGFWRGTRNATEAQLRKFEYIAEKVNLAACDTVLEVGSGWGSFAKFCQLHFPNVQVHGLTLSESQKAFVKSQDWAHATIYLSDWKDFHPARTYDAIVSVESIEHYASMEDRRSGTHIDAYRRFFEWCRDCTTDRALIYVQSSIARRNPDDLQSVMDSRLIVERVFTGSALPTLASLQLAAAPLYEFEELQLHGQDMALTMAAWGAQLKLKEQDLRARFGDAAVKFMEDYFDAGVRCFRKGHVDTLALTLRRAALV